MRKSLLLLSLMFFILNCGEEGASGLSEGEVIELKALNELNSSMDTAIDIGVGARLDASDVNNKTEKMIQLIAGKCEAEGARPDLSFDRTETDLFTVNGGVCPFNLNVRDNYNINTRRWEIYQNFVVRADLEMKDKGKEFALVSRVYSRTMQGHINRQIVNGGYGIGGTVEIRDFRTEDYGVISAKISTNQTYAGDTRGGQVSMILSSSKGWSHDVRITFDSGALPKFVVNGSDFERKDFEEMFSSYRLIEIMENGERMR